MNDSSYIPGMCNINTAEIARRRKAMWFGVVCSVIALIALFVLHISWWLSVILLFVPVYIAAIGHLQVTQKFCVAYGSTGRQNASEDSSSAQVISDESARKADKAKTQRMYLQALGITVVVVAVVGVIRYVA